MLVSVIIPVYNGEKYIRKAIDSALNQEFPRHDYEIIVVDDGSTDETGHIIDSLPYGNDLHISGTHHMSNRGTAGALNTGIKQAKGYWIKWLSADDEMLPRCLDTMIDRCHDNNTIYYTNYHIIDQFGKKTHDFVEAPKDKRVLWDYFYGNGSSSFIHRDVFDKCGLFDESLRFGEDYEFWLRATMLYNVNLTRIPEFTINYRRHPDQLTHKVGGGNDKIIKERIKSQITVR